MTVTRPHRYHAGDTVFLHTGTTGACGTFNTTVGHHQCLRCGDVHLHRWLGPWNVHHHGAVESLSSVQQLRPRHRHRRTTTNSVAVTANPASVVDNGTVDVDHHRHGDGSDERHPLTVDVVGFTQHGNVWARSPPQRGATNSSGVVSVVYTSATTAGFCTITATEDGTAQTGTCQMDNMT